MKDINFKDNIVKKNKIPILMYTPEWIQLFNNYRSESLQRSIEELEAVLDRERSCDKEMRELEKRKRILMNKILRFSNELNEENNQDALILMEEAQKELLEINDRIPLLLEELEALPELINEKNTALLKDTIKRAYELINEHNDESEKCQEEVNELRKLLGSLIQRKVELQERVTKLYSYIHGMVGAAEMENLDDRFWEDKS